jgi:hypothetical protein
MTAPTAKSCCCTGFDTHDTHHAISAYCADASGAFYMGEGRFLHSPGRDPLRPAPLQ